MKEKETTDCDTEKESRLRKMGRRHEREGQKNEEEGKEKQEDGGQEQERGMIQRPGWKKRGGYEV